MMTPPLPQNIRQIILQFLPISDIYSRATLLNKEWHETTEAFLTWKTVAQVNWPSMNEFLARLETSERHMRDSVDGGESDEEDYEESDEEEMEKPAWVLAMDKGLEEMKKEKGREKEKKEKKNKKQKEEENLMEMSKKEEKETSGKRTRCIAEQPSNKKRKKDKLDIHETEYWKKLVIARFERDTRYAYQLLAATRKFVHSGTEERSTSDMKMQLRKTTLTEEIYDINLTKSETNNYITFMHDSILYKTISKNIIHEYQCTRYEFFIGATFLDHLFREHSVSMQFVQAEFEDHVDVDTPFAIKFDEEQAKRVKRVNFVASIEDRTKFSANKEAVKKLCTLLQIDEDDPDKPSIRQFDHFFKRFYFFDSPLREYHFFTPG